jgi:galactonate dehydratase
MPDVAGCGGPAEGKHIANMAELDHVPFAPHDVSSAVVHVRAAVSNFAVLEWHAIEVPRGANFVRYSGGEIIQDGRIELTEARGWDWS